MIATSIEDHVSSRKAMLEDLLARIAKYQDDDVRTGQEKRLVRNIEILDRMKQKANAIRTDANLSEAGMATQLRQLAKATLGEFGPLFEAADSAEKNYLNAYAELSKIPDVPAGRSEIATLLREQEIRTMARALPLHALMQNYLTAVRSGDMEFVRAIRTAPGPALLSVDFVERVERERLELTNGDKLVRLESLDILRKELRGIAEMLRNWLKGYEEVKFPTAEIKQGQPYMASR